MRALTGRGKAGTRRQQWWRQGGLGWGSTRGGGSTRGWGGEETLARSRGGSATGSGSRGGSVGGQGCQGGGYRAAEGGNRMVRFAAALQVGGGEFCGDTTVAAEFKWQCLVNGETPKIQAFMERVLGLQEFKAFVFMISGLPWVQVGHGLGKLFSLFGMVPELDGKVLMFVGLWEIGGGQGTQSQSNNQSKIRGSGFCSRW